MKFLVEISCADSASKKKIEQDIFDMDGIEGADIVKEEELESMLVLREIAMDIFQLENSSVPLREGLWSPLRALREKAEQVLKIDVSHIAPATGRTPAS